ncbi:hypothetical protein ACQ4PT_054863 [Festuca glaucescens]
MRDSSTRPLGRRKPSSSDLPAAVQAESNRSWRQDGGPHLSTPRVRSNLGKRIWTQVGRPLVPTTASVTMSVLRLRGAVQHYEWGGHGDASLVQRLARERGVERLCVELWMCTLTGRSQSAP